MMRTMGMMGMVMMIMWLSWQRDDRLGRIPCLSVAATLKQTFYSSYQAATYRILAILLCGWYVIYIQDISIQCNTTQQAYNTRRRQYGRNMEIWKRGNLHHKQKPMGTKHQLVINSMRKFENILSMNLSSNWTTTRKSIPGNPTQTQNWQIIGICFLQLFT